MKSTKLGGAKLHKDPLIGNRANCWTFLTVDSMSFCLGRVNVLHAVPLQLQPHFFLLLNQDCKGQCVLMQALMQLS